MTGLKVEIPKLSVLALIIIAGIVLIVLGYIYSDDLFLRNFGLLVGYL